MLKAELLVSKGDLGAAAKAIKAAEEAVESNRMSLLMCRVEQLKERYEKALAEAST